MVWEAFFLVRYAEINFNVKENQDHSFFGSR